MVSDDSEPPPVLDDNTRLVNESDDGPTTHAAKSAQKVSPTLHLVPSYLTRCNHQYSPAKPLKWFDPEVDMEDIVVSSSRLNHFKFSYFE